MLPRTFIIAASIAALPLIASAARTETFRNGDSIHGQPATTAAAAAASVVDANAARHFNARYGQTVVFTNGAKKFAWTFDGLDNYNVRLERIVPPDFGPTALTVHIDKDPLKRN